MHSKVYDDMQTSSKNPSQNYKSSVSNKAESFGDFCKKSTLYVVATPIGNLEDITFRAVKILNEVSLIAAEDTRHTLKLLAHYKISTPVISCHEHNEESRINMLVGELSQGCDVALVSDAGTPLISDPGFRLVKGVIDAGFNAIPIPGPCAAIAGLSVSGLPTDSFIFAGFPNRKQSKRFSKLEELINTSNDGASTIVFYESPHRIVRLIEDILNVMGDRQAMVAREITKHYEEYLRGKLSHIHEVLSSRASIKGECALFVGSSKEIEKAHEDETSEQLELFYDELDQTIISELKSSDIKTSALAKRVAQQYNLSRYDVYKQILKIKTTLNL